MSANPDELEELAVHDVLPRKNPCRYLMVLPTLLATAALITSCAYQHYLGMHGPSIKKNPTIHASQTNDQSCLTCHDPKTSVVAPKTNHANFTGCLKCHNDDVSRGSLDRRDWAVGSLALRFEGEAGR